MFIGFAENVSQKILEEDSMRHRLRIHFTVDDLARTTVTTRPGTMWELVTSLHKLRSPRPAVRYQPWLRHVRARLGARDLRHVLLPLMTLVPQRGDFPDFFTPPGQADLAESIELFRSVPAHRLRLELATVFRDRHVPSWVRLLAEGDLGHRRELMKALTVYHKELLRPWQDELADTLLAERARCGPSVLNDGVECLLSTLAPSATWTAPVLSVDYPCDRDLHLGGRGITLVPSFFCSGAPVTLIDPELPPVLVYPVTGHRRTDSVSGGLATLLGHTRARAVQALSCPCSTTELAQRLRVTTGTASRHAAALREAGLVTSTRHGNTMVHTTTRLGQELAAGAGQP